MRSQVLSAVPLPLLAAKKTQWGDDGETVGPIHQLRANRTLRCIPRPMTSAMPMAKTSREMVKGLRITKQVATLDQATMCWECFGKEH